MLNAINGKTYLGALGLLIAGALKFIEKDYAGGGELLMLALTTAGIGHKIEKSDASRDAKGE